jgi:predicted nucleotidyltransferase
MLTRSGHLHLVLPVGTKVLTRREGRVGIVLYSPSSPEHAYRIRFPDGAEESYRRSDLTIYKHEQDAIPMQAELPDLLRFVAYRCVVGSTAYGLATDSSDIDRRGFYLPPADLHWSLAGVPEQLETEHEETYWEIGKFIRLALKANPNVLECLYSPLVEKAEPMAERILAARYIFLSQYVHRTYNAYVLSQFKKLEQDLRNHGQVRWKHVMHLIRLLLSGVVVLRDGLVPLRVDAHREALLSIRRGEVPWEEVEQWRLSLHKELDRALEQTSLPPHPDYEAANQLLVSARRLAAAENYGRD